MDPDPEIATLQEPEEPKGLTRKLDEAFRWRYFLLGLVLIAVAAALYVDLAVPWDLIAVGTIAFLVAVGAAALVGLPIALRRASAPPQKAIVSLDNREASVRVRVHFVDPDETVRVRWGELEPIPGTSVPAWLALRYDPETGEAWGTQRSTASPDELERKFHRIDEFYRDLEEEAAQKRVLEHSVRVAARRAADRIVAYQDRQLEEMTVPGGDTVTDVLDELLPERTEAEAEEDDTDDLDPVPEQTPDEALPALPEAVADGGVDE